MEQIFAICSLRHWRAANASESGSSERVDWSLCPQGGIFSRPAPNTFGLIEFDAAQPKKGPPPGSGKDVDTREQEDYVAGEGVMEFS